eukprot:2401147-Amphidinium_carterae.1
MDVCLSLSGFRMAEMWPKGQKRCDCTTCQEFCTQVFSRQEKAVLQDLREVETNHSCDVVLQTFAFCLPLHSIAGVVNRVAQCFKNEVLASRSGALMTQTCKLANFPKSSRAR